MKDTATEPVKQYKMRATWKASLREYQKSALDIQQYYTTRSTGATNLTALHTDMTSLQNSHK